MIKKINTNNKLKIKKMDTQENNKIIAEFMGLSKNLHLYESPITGKYIEVLRYDTSWNWLMEVVAKIKPLARNGNYHYKLLMVMSLEMALQKEIVYNACLGFIKWYNEQNKN